MTQRALIIGVGGQDGSLLQRSLERQGVAVVGLSRQGVLDPERLLGDATGLSVLDLPDVEQLMAQVQPDEVYYLAAYHASSERDTGMDHPDQFQRFHEVHVQGLLNVLWSVVQHSRHSRIFYAASSLVFDGSVGPVQNEDTPFSPVGYYGLTKTQGIGLCRQFRKSHGVHASAGILYSHESALRGDSFLSKKLIKAAHEIALGQREHLQVGSLQARNDWGYAPDYVEAFQAIVRQAQADDYVVASGELHSVEEFARIVFGCFGLDAARFVSENAGVLNRVSPPKQGDTRKLNRQTGWKPGRSFQAMVERLVADYLETVGGPAA